MKSILERICKSLMGDDNTWFPDAAAGGPASAPYWMARSELDPCTVHAMCFPPPTYRDRESEDHYLP